MAARERPHGNEANGSSGQSGAGRRGTVPHPMPRRLADSRSRSSAPIIRSPDMQLHAGEHARIAQERHITPDQQTPSERLQERNETQAQSQRNEARDDKQDEREDDREDQRDDKN